MEVTQHQEWLLQHMTKEEAETQIELIIGKFGAGFVCQSIAKAFREIYNNEDGQYSELDVQRADFHIKLMKFLDTTWFDTTSGQVDAE